MPSNVISATINNAAQPTITPAGTNNVILLCFGGGTSASQVLTASVASGTPTYAWYQVPSTVSVGTSATYTASINNTTTSKTFHVKASYANGCIRTSVNKIVRKNTSCRENTTFNTTLTSPLLVSPNPTQGRIEVTLKGINSVQGMLTVVNTLGQVVFSEKITLSEGNANHSVDLQTVSQGVYYLHFDTDIEHYVEKVVKE